MRIATAIYQLSEIQRTSRGHRVLRDRARPTQEVAERSPRTDSSVPAYGQPDSRQPIPTLGGMLREHFINEVRRRDRDGDGLLNLREYGGTKEDFGTLDRDGDSLIGAQDLIRETLNRSPQLAEMVTGPWAPVYDQLLAVREPNTDTFVEAIHAGAVKIKEAKESQQLQAPDRNGLDVSKVIDSATDIYVDFVSRHEDLADLYRRLQDLADRLGRTRQYTPIDMFA